MSQGLFDQIQSAITNFDEGLLARLTDRVIAEGINPVEAIENGFTAGIKRIGDLFESGEIFLPELMQAGRMVKESVTRLEAMVPRGSMKKKGKVLMGTVEGDIHDIGKDLVITMLTSRELEVVDIGVDCPASKFVDRALEEGVDLIGASALLTMTVPELKKIIQELERRGLRDRFGFMVGGAAVTADLAREIGADGYGADLKEAVDVAMALLEAKKGGK